MHIDVHKQQTNIYSKTKLTYIIYRLLDDLVLIDFNFLGHQNKINPYIHHWEPVDFDRSELEAAHQKHIEQKRHRRKRDLSQNQFGPAHTIKLNFRAHDK